MTSMCLPNLCNKALGPWVLLTSCFWPSFLSASLHLNSCCENFSRVLSWWPASASLVVCSLASPAAPKLFTSKRAQPVHTHRFLYHTNRFSLCAVLFPTRSLAWRFASWAHNWYLRTCGIGLILGLNCLNFEYVFHKSKIKYRACHWKFPRRHRSSVLNIFDVTELRWSSNSCRRLTSSCCTSSSFNAIVSRRKCWK